MTAGATSATGRRARMMAVLDRVNALAEMALAPGGLRALRTQRPLSLSAFALTSRLARIGLRPRLLLDAGAHTGQFTSAALLQWPQLRAHLFEPLPEAYRELEKRFSSRQGVQLHQIALGDTDGASLLHRHEHSMSSSLLPSAPAARERFDWAREAGDIEIQVRRLDSVLSPESLDGPVLWKIDVQGFEGPALSGAGALLGRIDAILVEQSFDTFYEGQLPFALVQSQLGAEGWELARVLALRSEAGVPVEADCLYLPARLRGSLPV